MSRLSNSSSSSTHSTKRIPDDVFDEVEKMRSESKVQPESIETASVAPIVAPPMIAVPVVAAPEAYVSASIPCETVTEADLVAGTFAPARRVGRVDRVGGERRKSHPLAVALLPIIWSLAAGVWTFGILHTYVTVDPIIALFTATAVFVSLISMTCLFRLDRSSPSQA